MSHFTVIVCTDGPDSLEKALAPFDENREVEPYRDYEEGGPTECWLYGALKRASEDFAAGTGLLPYKPDEIGWSSSSSKKTHAEQRQEQAADAKLFQSLPDPITWADIAKVHNERYGDESDPILVDDEGRAYTMSTRNPDAKWDWYQVGGRRGGYFPYKQESAGLVINGERGWSSPKDIKPQHCDGGPKHALALASLREEKAAEARKAYADWTEVIAGTPDALPWKTFAENISPENGYTADEARAAYRAQPRVQAFQQTDFKWRDDPIADFSIPEALYVERQKARAVPGYAILTADGRWMAPGRMGWFGMSTDEVGDRIGYWEASNAYIESLPDDAWLIAVDCHI